MIQVERLTKSYGAKVAVDSLDLRVEPGEMISYVNHPYERYAVDLYLYECRISSGEPSPVNVSDFRWVMSSEFDRYNFTPADEASMSKLLGVS